VELAGRSRGSKPRLTCIPEWSGDTAAVRLLFTFDNDSHLQYILTGVVADGIWSMYVCLCKGITEDHIRSAVVDGASSFGEVRSVLGVSTQCGKCSLHARSVFHSAITALGESELFYSAVAAAG